MHRLIMDEQCEYPGMIGEYQGMWARIGRHSERSRTAPGARAMREDSILAWGDRDGDGRKRWSAKGSPVRMALVSWPAVVLIGASVPAAACLLSQFGQCASAQAKKALVGQAGTVKSIAFRPDGTMLSSVGVDGSMVIWDLEHPPHYPLARHDSGQVRSAAFSPDNRLLATVNPAKGVFVLDLLLDESRRLGEMPSSSCAAACAAFARDGATLAVGQTNGKITLWNPKTGHRRATLEGHTNYVASLAFAPGGAVLASSSSDRSVRIWDLSTFHQLYVIGPANTLLAQAFSPDGRFLVQCDQVTPVVRLWDVTTGAEHAVLHGPTSSVLAAAVSPDGMTLAAADFQGTITFWDLATLKIQAKRLCHSGVRTLAFAPDGRALATGGFDGTVHVWDLAGFSEN
jgi:WD40 repeat protein